MRTRKLRAEIVSQFADVAHWNRLHPDDEPLDADPDGQLAQIACALDATLAREAPDDRR